ncbi:unnamed protein product, partial [Effrenium voratum]
MKRINNLAASTATKKKKWKIESDDEEPPVLDGPLPDSDDEPAAPAPKAESSSAGTTGSPNPVVWMEIEVAGKARGRLHFELFQDLAPKAAATFRQLCAAEADGKTVSYAGTSLDLVYAGRYVTAGDIDASLSFEGVEGSCSLTHAKAGLLTMPFGSASFFDPRFQITLGAVSELDGKQLIFG